MSQLLSGVPRELAGEKTARNILGRVLVRSTVDATQSDVMSIWRNVGAAQMGRLKPATLCRDTRQVADLVFLPPSASALHLVF